LQSYTTIVLNENVTLLGVKTYSDPSYIFSGGQDPCNPQVLRPQVTVQPKTMKRCQIRFRTANSVAA